jgi:hypothetical protein
MPDAGTDLGSLAEQLAADPEGLLARWIEALCGRSWKLRACLQDGRSPDTLELLRKRCRHFIDALERALKASTAFEVGSPEFREAVQCLSFTAGWMAGEGLPVTDAVGLVHGLEDALGWQQTSFFQALMVVVAEAYAASLVQREHGRFRDVMEKSQLVCAPHAKLPCLFLVGAPDRQALDDAVGRVMMLAVMRDARVVLVDGSALICPEKALPQACQILTEHADAAAVRAMLSGAPPAVAIEIRAAHGEQLVLFEAFDEALAAAMRLAGLGWSVA